MLITTSDNSVFFLSPDFELKQINFEVEPEEEVSRVTQSLIFELKGVMYLCLGFSNGEYAV